VLTRQDWRGPSAGWTPTSVGHWELRVRKAGRFEMTAFLPTPLPKEAVLHVKIGKHMFMRKLSDPQRKSAIIGGIALPAGPFELEAWITEGDSVRGVRFVELRRE
jgi:arylsulfatase/arylsulfatase A